MTAQAENESNGSAIAAISLLRSTSGSGVLPMSSSSGAKRNMTSLSKPHPRDPDGDEPAQKRRMLARAISSIARLETTEAAANTRDAVATPAKESPHDRLKVARLLSPTDSDKENLSPDEDGNPRSGGLGPRRPLPPTTADTTAPKSGNPRRTAGRALQENGASLLNARANTVPGSLKRAGGKDIDIFEDAKKVALSPGKRAAGRGGKEDDVDKFMRGSVSPSKKPDMDCVAGLLSLSQGAWR